MTRIGVCVARFQVPVLSQGHLSVLREATKDNDLLLVFLGTPVFRGPTARNPLSFEARYAMLEEQKAAFWGRRVHVEPLMDMEDDADWSAELDKRIGLYTSPGDHVTLYGGRNSFVDCYSGRYKTQVVSTYGCDSGTVTRAALKAHGQSSAAFRSGIIYATQTVVPNVSAVVDVAIVDTASRRILLGRKPNDKHWRLPGGFVDREDASMEAAARREAQEETGLDLQNGWNNMYVHSISSNDWRIRGDKDKGMMVALYLFSKHYADKEAYQAGDDLEHADWHDLCTAESVVVHNHKPHIKALERLMNPS